MMQTKRATVKKSKTKVSARARVRLKLGILGALPLRKLATIAIILLLALVAGFFSFMLVSERMLLRSPVLILVSPRVTFALGASSYREREEADWKNVAVGTSFGEGYEVKTGPGALLDLRFHDGTTVRIIQNTHVKISHLIIKRLVIEVYGGSLYGRFKKLFTEHHMKITTPTSTVAVRGTELGIEVGWTAPSSSGKNAPVSRRRKGRAAAPEPASEKPVLSTTVYGMSGVVEVVNPKFKDRPVLVGNRCLVRVDENSPPSDPVKIPEDTVIRLQTIINALHDEEVLLITDKIHFETDSATILAASYPELDRIVDVLKKRQAKVRIEGHTDITGTASINQPLSYQRARSIRSYFVKKGFEAKRFVVAGYGSSKPIADNRTAEGRAHNRRVEFIVIE